MPLILRLALLLGLMAMAQAADAACTLATGASVDFGQRTSYDVRAGGAPPLAAPQTLACNGSVLSLVATDYARATTTSANGFQLRSAGGDAIGYRLSADPSGAYGFAQGGAINYLDPALLSLLGILDGNSFAPTLYAALTDRPNVPAGTYADTVTIQWSWAICRGVGVGGLCVLQERNSGTTTLRVAVTVTKDCRISAPAVSFGAAPLARQFAAVTQAVAVDCTRGATFSLAFTAGAGAGATPRPWRRMRDGAGHVLRYNLYRPDGLTIWDETNPLALASAGTGAAAPTLLQGYVARIDPDQPTPAPGSYSDTVSVVVVF